MSNQKLCNQFGQQATAVRTFVSLQMFGLISHEFLVGNRCIVLIRSTPYSHGSNLARSCFD